MELDVVMPQKVKVKSVFLHAKLCDSGSYELRDESGKEVASRSDYVPSFFPDDEDGSSNYGDYLMLNIDLETGQILNWKKPNPADVARAFGLSKESE